jgi:hypothetical protein
VAKTGKSCKVTNVVNPSILGGCVEFLDGYRELRSRLRAGSSLTSATRPSICPSRHGSRSSITCSMVRSLYICEANSDCFGTESV